MARIRCIKPEFPQSQSMGEVSRDARLLFVELWTLCDDHGKARASPRMLASLLFPYDDDAPGLIEGWLGELEGQGCVERYEISGTHYLRVVNWSRHQKIDRPSQSRFPDPPHAEASRGLDDSRRGIKDRGEEGIEDRGGEPAPQRNGRAHALPENWQPEEEDIAWAAKARPDLDRAALDAETERFRLHASAHSRTAHRWGAGWRLWVSKARVPVAAAATSSGGARGNDGGGSYDDDGQWRVRLKSYKPGKFWLEGDWGPRPESGRSRVPGHLLSEWRGLN